MPQQPYAALRCLQILPSRLHVSRLCLAYVTTSPQPPNLRIKVCHYLCVFVFFMWFQSTSDVMRRWQVSGVTHCLPFLFVAVRCPHFFGCKPCTRKGEKDVTVVVCTGFSKNPPFTLFFGTRVYIKKKFTWVPSKENTVFFPLVFLYAGDTRKKVYVDYSKKKKITCARTAFFRMRVTFSSLGQKYCS